ncbi:translation initiation factor eIF3 subunit [Suhomyces tanzawaensis NRRL Y-17324]|uniref:Eukaryotic translation initiation factor 3 subunit B n=1 Tax=Suhomyces tanzawaensis NRRL Y-17324 TaxID=984487 RepID=A0A1E4SIW8_9ASCO|nr:translation initiation factor eIF3 subunit [Suhomyces tanzawaensis NRRL Y-17324]ODV79456.1 translation initiation factor eIF3 subunit [Suhomyces tanzawaensis NRRL Y-17324]
MDNYEELEKEIRLDDIDFSDLEEKFEVNVGLDNFVVVDGAPIAPEAKASLLTNFIRKKLSTVGEIVEGEEGIHMPIENGQTKGFLFVQYTTAELADAAVKQLNGKPLDKSHNLKINKLADIEKYCTEGNVANEFQEPELPPFKSHGYLKSWLQDDAGRDQIALHFSETVGVYWNKKNNDPEPVIEPRKAFTSKYAKFSPKGTFLFSIHPQGIQSWGGADFHSVSKFIHNQVRLVDFSPNEKYMVTLSPLPITVPDSAAERAHFPFGPESEGHKLVIWDLATGEPARTFALPPYLESQKEMPWPLVKWSFDDKYCARQGPGALAIYETPSFNLLDKKLVKIDGLMDFEWAPAGVHLANSKVENGEHVLSYWTPESTNQTARVALMQIPSKQVLRTVNLFQVSDCKMHWHDEGKLLCVKVDRHTKSGKTLFTNLEFFKTTERDVPVEKLELKEVVVNFAWEPKSERFVIISCLDDGTQNAAFAKNSIVFYAPDAKAKGKVTSTTYKVQQKFDTKYSNTIEWSPKGKYVVVATISRSQGELEFYDVAFEEEKKKTPGTNVKLLRTDKFSGMTNLAWDPSGRFVAAWSSSWLHTIENGYRLYEFTGNLLKDESVDQFREFIWRPRPASLLSAADRKKVRSKLSEYSAQFEEIDAMEADAAVREAILARRKALEEWRTYRAQYAGKAVKTNEVQAEIIEEIKEEIFEEKEEIVE